MSAEYECEVCGDEVPTEDGLESHMGKMHPETLPWNDEEELERLYNEKDLFQWEIADRMECSQGTINRKMEEFGIGCESNPWDDPEKLERLYWEEGLFQEDIAEEMGCSVGRISIKMKEYGIESRSRSEASSLGNPIHSNPAYYRIGTSGYERWVSAMEEEKKSVSVHQLLACLNNDPHEVFADDTVVHHGNNNHPTLPETEHKLANWEGNLEVMSRSKHRIHHINTQKESTQPEVQSAMDW